jgi:hypothetical protein
VGHQRWLLTGGDSIPKIFSHEIAEALSDPDLGSGIIVNGSDEIGDVCSNTWSSVNGHAEEAYWSQADRRCVIPVLQALPASCSPRPGRGRLSEHRQARIANTFTQL